ncbi:MAG: sulfurtransferase complex subunit TusB [Methanomassiliicoccus sp.]|nr:sulfurtransferase complex subunit TusB [Methanomassiliicoccus sp.]
MSSTLFILLKSPHEYHDLDAVAALGGDDRIGVLLFEDATLFTVLADRREEIVDVADEVYVMEDDLEARGFKGRAGKGFEVINYPRAVDLIMNEYDQTITL